MPFIGNKPAQVPLTSADIADGIITSAKITDATIVNGDIANATIALAKLSATGTADATTFLRGDNSWGSAGAAAGQVIQVVTATDSTSRTTNSTSFVAVTGLSVSITPSSASNKIFVLVTSAIGMDNGQFVQTIFRGATNIGNGNSGMARGSNSIGAPLAMSILDSPNTTSATTYQAYMRTTDSSYTHSVNWDSTKGSITCFEIKG